MSAFFSLSVSVNVICLSFCNESNQMCLPFTKRDPLKDQFQKKIYFLGCFIFILFLYYILKICCTYVLTVPIENWNTKSQPGKIRNNDGTIYNKLILCSGFLKFILVHFSNGRINVYQKQVETGNYFFLTTSDDLRLVNFSIRKCCYSIEL